MRSKFLAENRWLLKLCSRVARLCGLLLLLGTGVLAAVMVVVALFDSKVVVTGSGGELLLAMPHILFYGLLALILAEFISYLLAEQGEPKWILRHGDKIIYAYVLYAAVMSAICVAHLREVDREIGAVDREFGTMVSLREVHLWLALAIALIIVRMLIWIGIAIVLRKVVPIIRESKTLV